MKALSLQIEKDVKVQQPSHIVKCAYGKVRMIISYELAWMKAVTEEMDDILNLSDQLQWYKQNI